MFERRNAKQQNEHQIYSFIFLFNMERVARKFVETQRLKPINNECFSSAHTQRRERERDKVAEKVKRSEKRKHKDGKLKWMSHRLVDLAFNVILNIAIHCSEFGICDYVYVCRQADCIRTPLHSHIPTE